MERSADDMEVQVVWPLANVAAKRALWCAVTVYFTFPVFI